MKTVLVAILSFAATIAFAAQKSETNSQSAQSLEAQAQSEIATLTTGAKKAQSARSTDASLPAESLSLKDDFKSPRARDYDFGFMMGLRPHQIKGKGSIPGAGDYALNAGSTWMPVFGLGIERNFLSKPSFFNEVRVGLNGWVGFISQEMKVAQTNGSANVRLNSTSTEAEVFAEASMARAPRLGLGLGYGYSQLSVTQAGSESLSQWTKQLRQNFSSVFANYRLTPGWSAQLAVLSRRNLTGESSVISQDRSLYQAGFKVIW